MLTLLALALAAAPAVSNNPPAACPTISVWGSSDTGAFGVTLKGGDSNVIPTFNWTVSDGAIEAGQSTSLISVDADPGQSVTATIEVGGYPRECRTTASGMVTMK